MNTALHECISLANCPCTGICSTSMAPFDETCKGCGRNVDQIRDWETFLDRINIMSADSKQKIKDIQGRLITIQSLIEMVGKDMIDEFGQNPAIKEAYQALFASRENILKTKENFPQDS